MSMFFPLTFYTISPLLLRSRDLSSIWDLARSRRRDCRVGRRRTSIEKHDEPLGEEGALVNTVERESMNL